MNCESFCYYVLLGVPVVGVQRLTYDRSGCSYTEYIKRMNNTTKIIKFLTKNLDLLY